jgi:hypothetical protein
VLQQGFPELQGLVMRAIALATVLRSATLMELVRLKLLSLPRMKALALSRVQVLVNIIRPFIHLR